MIINEVLATVSIIIQISAGATIGSASGFFYTHNDNLFLVTNRHVVEGEKGKEPDSLRVILHKSRDIKDSEPYDIQLYEDKQPLWKSHTKSKEADIALIKLDKKIIKDNYFVRAFSSSSFLPEKYQLNPGEDVFIIGYPKSFHDSAHNLPIFRNAMIASTYRVPFHNSPLFLTDANLHPGTSGSPVLTKPKNTWVDDKGNVDMVTGTKYYLVGVHSGTIDPKITGGENIGLGAAWYAELIEDIAKLF